MFISAILLTIVKYAIVKSAVIKCAVEKQISTLSSYVPIIIAKHKLFDYLLNDTIPHVAIEWITCRIFLKNKTTIIMNRAIGVGIVSELWFGMIELLGYKMTIYHGLLKALSAGTNGVLWNICAESMTICFTKIEIPKEYHITKIIGETVIGTGIFVSIHFVFDIVFFYQKGLSGILYSAWNYQHCASIWLITENVADYFLFYLENIENIKNKKMLISFFSIGLNCLSMSAIAFFRGNMMILDGKQLANKFSIKNFIHREVVFAFQENLGWSLADFIYGFE